MRGRSRWWRVMALVFLGDCWDPGVGQAAPEGSKSSSPEELTSKYEQLYAEENYAEATPLAKKACLMLEEIGGQPEKLASCLNGLAVLYEAQGELAKAESLHSRALSIYEDTLGLQHPYVATSLNNIAVLHYIRGDYDKAKPLFLQALSIRESAFGSEDASVAECLNNLATLYRDQGEYGKAEPLFLRALSIHNKLPNPKHSTVASTLENLALVYNEQGKYDKAEPLLLRALSLRERMLGPQHPSLGASLNNLGWLYSSKGQHDKAEPLLQRALVIISGTFGPHHPNTAACLNNLARLYKDQGEYDKAEPLYVRALSIVERALGPQHPHVAQCLNNLAVVYHHQREDRKAEPLHLRALAIAEQAFGPHNPNIAQHLNNLGLFYYDNKDYARAEPLLLRALSIVEAAFGPHNFFVAISLINLARLYRGQGEYVKAVPLCLRAISIFEKALNPRSTYVGIGLNHLGSLELALGRLESSLGHHRSAMDIEEESLARTLVIAEDSRRLSLASRLFESTHRALSFHLQADPNDRSAAELALTTLLRRKGRVEDITTQSSAALFRSLPQEGQRVLKSISSVQSQYAALTHRGPRKGTIPNYRVRLAALEREQNRLWSQIARLSPQIRALTKLITIPDVQSNLPGDATLIEYVSYRAVYGAGTPSGTNEERYAVYILFPDRFEWVDLGSAAPIDKQIKAFREAIILNADADTSGQALYDSIMQPVVDRIGLTNRMFISPDGNLNLVPFDALIDEYDNYLVQRFHLHYLTSGRDLLRSWMFETPADGPVVVVANPAGADLPGTDHEATLLASLLGGVVTMQHEVATESQLRTHQRPRILHLATHGTFGTGRPGHTLLDAPAPDDDLFHSGTSVFDGLPPTQLDNPMLYSWLDLATPPAPPDDQPDTDEALLDDGRLTAYEVSGWDLRGTELVTLSACDTAQGTYQQGEGILGLRRAFAIAGAQTQVMSLWKVSDTTTATLMEKYYRRLLAGEGRSEAMRNTQLELLRDPATRHPRDWAAFVVVGEWGPLSSVSPPPKAEPDPIDSRPRGCQATITTPYDQPNTPATTLFVLPFLALTPRRRRLARPKRSYPA